MYNCTISIQKWVRMFVTRRRFLVQREERREELRRIEAGIVIQSWFRMIRARREFHEKKDEMRRQSILVRVSKRCLVWSGQFDHDLRRKLMICVKLNYQLIERG